MRAPIERNKHPTRHTYHEKDIDIALKFAKSVYKELPNITKGIIIFGELGGRHEYEIIELREKGLITKPIAIHIAGRFAETLPIGTSFGHAGSIVERGMGSVKAKEQALEKAGILVAHDVYDLPELIRDAFVR